MPALSKSMRQAAAIALHHPEKLYKRNRGLLGMTQEQLHHYASTKEKGLTLHKHHKKTKKKKKQKKKGRLLDYGKKK